MSDVSCSVDEDAVRYAIGISDDSLTQAVFCHEFKTMADMTGVIKSYFVSNSTRMQYEASRAVKLPTGSGVIESAIRRVINMRVKSPGSFWKLDFVETVIYLRTQVLYGRWGNIIKNWTHSFQCDFINIATKAGI